MPECIADDERRRDATQPLAAQRVGAADGRLRRCGSSACSPRREGSPPYTPTSPRLTSGRPALPTSPDPGFVRVP